MTKAICHNCNEDVLEELEMSFNNSCEQGPPDEVYFYCKSCDTLLMFEVETVYTMASFKKIILPTSIPFDDIHYEPDEDGYDYSLVTDFISKFSHILPASITDNRKLNQYFMKNCFYNNLDYFSDSTKNVSCWYFKTEEDTKIFVTRLNKWLEEPSSS